MADFYSILTDAGKTKLTAALTNKKPLVFAKMAAGDGSGAQYTVTSALTKLKNEKWRGDLRDIRISEVSEYQVVVEAIIPVEVGNFWIREIGLFDDAGTLIAIANYPDTFKPPLQSGVGKQIIIQLLITVQDQAAVTLIVSDNVSYATKAELNGLLKTSNNLIEIKNAGAAAQQAARSNLAIPDGSTTVKGMLQLYNGVDSTSTAYAATAAAVKVAYDKANAAQTAVAGAMKVYAQGAEPNTNQGDIYITGIGVCTWDATAPAGYVKKYKDTTELITTTQNRNFGKYVREVSVTLYQAGGGGGGGLNGASGGAGGITSFGSYLSLSGAPGGAGAPGTGFATGGSGGAGTDGSNSKFAGVGAGGGGGWQSGFTGQNYIPNSGGTGGLGASSFPILKGCMNKTCLIAKNTSILLTVGAGGTGGSAGTGTGGGAGGSGGAGAIKITY